MKFEVEISLKCDGLVQAINEICDVIRQNGVIKNDADKKCKDVKITTEEVKVDEKQESITTEEVKANEKQESITTENARAALAKLAKEKGKVIAQGIVKSFGVSKFTEISKENYPKLMKLIEEA